MNILGGKAPEILQLFWGVIYIEMPLPPRKPEINVHIMLNLQVICLVPLSPSHNLQAFYTEGSTSVKALLAPLRGCIQGP